MNKARVTGLFLCVVRERRPRTADGSRTRMPHVVDVRPGYGQNAIHA